MTDFINKTVPANDINSKTRPYIGSPHMFTGERGQTLVEGLTIRDIHDCMCQGFLAACNDPFLQVSTVEISKDMVGTKYANNGTWQPSDIYKIRLHDLDPMAVIQNTLSFIEHYMGIYPNVPSLEEPNKE